MLVRYLICLWIASFSVYCSDDLESSSTYVRHELFSSARASDEDYKANLEMKRKLYEKFYEVESKGSAYDLSLPIEEADYSSVQELTSIEELHQMFLIARDTKFLQQATYDGLEVQPDPSIEPRRISWLYPHDGCYARAGMAAIYIDRNFSIRLSKVFVYGNLSAYSDYEEDHVATWNYHVALGARVEDKVYIIDPALNFDEAIPIEDWYELITYDSPEEISNLTVSVCDTNTYGPYQSCHHPFAPVVSGPPGMQTVEFMNNSDAKEDEEGVNIEGYLYREWDNLTLLGYNPNELLGDNPPWLDSSEAVK